MPYSPAFQFYPKDYLGDKNTIPMGTLEHGAYCLLWMHCWQEDGLPDDMQELADMAKMSVEDFTPIWNRRIKKCFVWDAKKELWFHPRLLKEIKKQKLWKKEQSDRGKKAAASRWNKKGSGDASAMHTHADALHTDASSFSSSSSFSLSFPISSSDLKRLINACVRENSTVDPKAVEAGVYYTLLQRNGSTDPIKSLAYFTPQIQKVAADSKGLTANGWKSLLAVRRDQVLKSKAVQA